MENEKALLERQFTWVEYWMAAIQFQHDEDWVAEVRGEGESEPLYRDDTDRAINSVLVNTLLTLLTQLGATIKDRLDSFGE